MKVEARDASPLFAVAREGKNRKSPAAPGAVLPSTTFGEVEAKSSRRRHAERIAAARPRKNTPNRGSPARSTPSAVRCDVRAAVTARKGIDGRVGPTAIHDVGWFCGGSGPPPTRRKTHRRRDARAPGRPTRGPTNRTVRTRRRSPATPTPRRRAGTRASQAHRPARRLCLPANSSNGSPRANTLRRTSCRVARAVATNVKLEADPARSPSSARRRRLPPPLGLGDRHVGRDRHQAQAI